MSFKNLVLAVLTVGLFASCSGNGHKKDARSLETILETDTGQNFSVVKLHTAEGGDWAVFRNDSTGELMAYNLERFDRDTMTSLSQFEAVALDGDIVSNLTSGQEWITSGYWQDITRQELVDTYDSFCDCYQTEWVTVVIGQEYIDTSGYRTFYYGSGYRFENSTSASKDLETIAALDEEASQNFIASKLASEFSLSKNRSAELAKMVTKYNKLENARELTSSEKDHFALKALGVSYSAIENAVKKKAQGNNSEFSSLLEKAAEVNQTTTENIGSFFDAYVD